MKDIHEQIEKILAGDVRTIARTLTQIENSKDGRSAELLKTLFPHTGRAFIVGITGSSGTGKSTLVDQLAHRFSASGRRVGIVAVDPSSPFSGGALLGDRIRMQSLFTDPNVYIRSMATRGMLGGLAPAVQEALFVLDAAGYEILLVETVGVGQDEVDVARTAHATLVVQVPGLGDEIQNLKAGIMEIADVFVINKADRENAPGTERQLRNLLAGNVRDDGWTIPIVKTSAIRDEGIAELASAVEEFRTFLGELRSPGERTISIAREQLLYLIRNRLARAIFSRLSDEDLRAYAEKMVTRKLDPYTIMEWLFEELGLEEKTHD